LKISKTALSKDAEKYSKEHFAVHTEGFFILTYLKPYNKHVIDNILNDTLQ